MVVRKHASHPYSGIKYWLEQFCTSILTKMAILSLKRPILAIFLPKKGDFWIAFDSICYSSVLRHMIAILALYCYYFSQKSYLKLKNSLSRPFFGIFKPFLGIKFFFHCVKNSCTFVQFIHTKFDDINIVLLSKQHNY